MILLNFIKNLFGFEVEHEIIGLAEIATDDFQVEEAVNTHKAQKEVSLTDLLRRTN